MYLKRIIVLGTSGAGKTTLANDLKERLPGHHRIEMDALHWLPDWQERPKPELREMLAREVEHERWILDGNYGSVIDISWPRADTIIWLDYPRHIIMSRVTRRSLRRLVTREDLWGTGNRESLGRTLGTDSIIRWSWRTYARRRRDYPGMLAKQTHARVLRFEHPTQTQGFLKTVEALQALDV